MFEVLELSIAAITLSVVLFSIVAFVIPQYKYNAEKKQLYNQGIKLLEDMDLILNDADLDNSDLLYEIDLSLMDYYKTNNADIIYVANKLRDIRTPLFRSEDEMCKSLGEFLDWMMRDFYEMNQDDEDERIRVWANNVKTYRKRKHGLMHMRST